MVHIRSNETVSEFSIAIFIVYFSSYYITLYKSSQVRTQRRGNHPSFFGERFRSKANEHTLVNSFVERMIFVEPFIGSMEPKSPTRNTYVRTCFLLSSAGRGAGMNKKRIETYFDSLERKNIFPSWNGLNPTVQRLFT